MNKQIKQNTIRERRAIRTRAKLIGTKERPRISFHKTNQFVYLQLINDEARETMASVSTRGMKETTKGEKILKLAQALVNIAKEKGVAAAIMDRGKYKYHGTIKTITEEIRKSGITI